ncbi:glycine cleavage system transcriptional repressor [Desulfonatronum thiosulfatophilum]|uniref:Glycine cleavage system transcriptional repressor n=1 Tax=Desulfonatronum thiosulfatophilum TaxID=617002 RepID=A0A1G6BBH4_9BACT|nr:ACT domain-containing protein [Desulfonatronum thiosulfatophilum]SDB18042.1 glycine cleavage system transcriptional repressor [Desulfonatronum thiosulfatophilum]
MQDHVQKMMIAVFGRDRPGIVARVSGLLATMGCNIEDATQTILHSRFAGMFVFQPQAESLSTGDVLHALEQGFAGEELTFWVSLLDDATTAQSGDAGQPAAPFVITTIGPDQVGLVAGITEVLFRFGVNITALRANVKTEDASQWVMIYEVDVPQQVDRKQFREALYGRAQELRQILSLQHRSIFEAVHRV